MIPFDALLSNLFSILWRLYLIYQVRNEFAVHQMLGYKPIYYHMNAFNNGTKLINVLAYILRLI